MEYIKSYASKSDFNEALLKLKLPGIAPHPFGKTYFDSNNLEVYTHGLEFSTKNVVILNDEMTFKKGHLFVQGESLRIKDHPDTGLPFKNFEICFDFLTSAKNTCLFSLDSPIGRGGHDRHITLKNGQIIVRVWPGAAYTATSGSYSDGMWHTFRLLCAKG
jgi:hypothetical protein